MEILKQDKQTPEKIWSEVKDGTESKKRHCLEISVIFASRS